MSADTAPPPAAPSLADLYAEKAKRTATSNPALSALYTEKATRQGAPAQPAAPASFEEHPYGKMLLAEGNPDRIAEARSLYAMTPEQRAEHHRQREFDEAAPARERQSAIDAQYAADPNRHTRPGTDESFADRLGHVVDPFVLDTTGRSPYWKARADRANAGGGSVGSYAAETLGGAKDVVFGAISATPIGLGLQVAGAAAPGVVDPVMRNTFGLPGRGLKAVAGALGADENWQSAAESAGDLATLRYAPKAMERFSPKGRAAAADAGLDAQMGPTDAAALAARPIGESPRGGYPSGEGLPAPRAMTADEFEMRGRRPLPIPDGPARPLALYDGPRVTGGLTDAAPAAVKPTRTLAEPQQRTPFDVVPDKSRTVTQHPETDAAIIERMRLGKPLTPKQEAYLRTDPGVGEGPVPLVPKKAKASLRAKPPAGQIGVDIEPFNRARDPSRTFQGGGNQFDVREIGPEQPMPGVDPRDPSRVTPTMEDMRASGREPPPAPPGGEPPLPSPGDAPKAGLRAKPGIGAVIQAQTNQSIGNLKPFSDRLFYATKEIQSVRDRLSGSRLREFEQEYGKMSPKEQQGLTWAMLEERAAPDTPGQARFRDFWNDPENPQAFSRRLLREGTEAGLRVADKDAPGGFREAREVRRYAPNRMSVEAMEQMKNDPAMQAEFYGEATRQGLTKEQADAKLAHYREPGVRSYFAGQEAPREFKVPDKWRPADVGQTLRETASRSTRNETEQRVMKYRDPETGAPRNVGRDGQMQGDLGDMLEDVRKKHGQGAADEAKDLFLEQVGRKPQSDLTHSSKALSNKLGAINAVRLYTMRLTTSAIQQTQHAMTAAHSGIAETMKAAARVASHPMDVYDAAIRAGAVEPLSNWSNVVGIHEGGTPRTFGQRVTNVATTPMAVSDMSARLVAFETRMGVAAKLQRQLNGNVWQKGVARTMIEAMDYPPQAAEAFARGLDQKSLDILGQRIVEKTQGKISDATRIPLARGPLGRIVMQGKNFGVEQTRNTWRVAGKQLFQAKNPVPAAVLLASAWAMGKGINKAKDFLVGPQKSRDESDLSALQQGGLGGMAGDVGYSMIRAKSTREAIEQLKRLDETQFTSLVFDVVKLGAGEWSPPQGKGRLDVLVDALHHAFPAENDWEKHFDRLFGDDSKLRDKIVKNSTSQGEPRKGSEDYVRRLQEAAK